MIITYDPNKNQRNINLRKLPFSLASLVLDDSQRLERHDDEHSTPDEDRWQTIGLAGKLLFVVYTERNEIPHIISLRLAEPDEKRLYYGDRNLYQTEWYRINP
jgi:uncharacterized DUF497 family protein